MAGAPWSRATRCAWCCPAAFVDVDVLSRGTWVEAVQLPGVGRDLLEGIGFPRSPGFQLWLDGERRHLSAAAEAVLHEAALACLVRDEADRAADHAAQLVGLNPFDENYQTLLVRCLSLAGDAEGAERQAAACEELFRSELGVEPTEALRAAARQPTPSVGVYGRATTIAQIEAGESAVAAGALESGLDTLRRAIAAARRSHHRDLLARALVSLGSSLVHAARGSDEEGAAALHEGIALAEALDDAVLAATAWREIGWVEFLRARYRPGGQGVGDRRRAGGRRRGGTRLDRPHPRRRIAATSGSTPLPRTTFTLAIKRADVVGADRPAAFARAVLGRLHLLRGELDDARVMLDAALVRVSAIGWTTFLPYPESYRAEVDLMAGDVDAAAERFEHAFSLGCQVGDPCWEGLACRGLGLVAAARGDLPRAFELLDEAPRRCRRLPDTYLWVEAYCLEALCAVGVAHGAASTGQWIDELDTIASRNGMRELLVRATMPPRSPRGARRPRRGPVTRGRGGQPGTRQAHSVTRRMTSRACSATAVAGGVGLAPRSR